MTATTVHHDPDPSNPIPSPAAPVRTSTARGAAWSTLAYVVIGAGQLLVMSALGHHGDLTGDNKNIIAASLVIIAFGKIFTTTGVGPAIVQREDLRREHLQTGFLISLGTGVIALAALGFGAPVIAWFFHNDRLIPLLWVLGLATLIQSSGIVAEGILQREFRFRALAIAEIVSSGVGFVGLGVFFALRGAGIWTLVLANLVQAVMKAAMVLAATRHPIGWRLDRTAGRDLGRFATGFTLAKIFNFAGVNGDNAVIGNRLPNQLGNYSQAYQLLAMPAMFFGQIVDRVLFPVMARMQTDIPRLAQTYRRGVGAIAAVTGPGGALIFVLAPEIVHLVYGGNSSDVVNPLRVFALGLTLRTGYKISDSLARSSGTVFKRAKRQAVYAVLVIVGAYVGHFWGITASAVGVLLALLANYLLMADLSLRTTGLTWGAFAGAHRRGAILGVLTGAVTLLVTVPLRRADVNFLLVMGAGLLATLVLLGALATVKRDLVLGDVAWLISGRSAPEVTGGSARPLATTAARSGVDLTERLANNQIDLQTAADALANAPTAGRRNRRSTPRPAPDAAVTDRGAKRG